MTDLAARSLAALNHLLTVLTGLRRAANLLAGAAVLGGTAASIGLILLGLPWWLALPVSGICLLPAFALLRLGTGLRAAMALPRQLRDLAAAPVAPNVPTSEIVDLATRIDALPSRPLAVRTFVTTLRSTRHVLVRLTALRAGQLTTGALALTPAAFFAGAAAALWAAAALFVGLLLLLAGLLS